MPVLNSVKRRMVEHLATLVNELHVGSDGTVATEDDGGVRTLASVTPTVRIIGDSSVLVEGTFGVDQSFSTEVQEVYLQYKDGTTGEYIPVYRTSIPAFSKSAQNEVQFSFILEVD
tara:strand:- start:120 stop:467 length:348 start_codon:yes stop_codon:yes gene_type:complete